MSSSLPERYNAVLKEIASAAIRANRDPSSIVIVAASKTRTVDEIESLYRLGHRDFGENYAQELIEKAEALKDRGITDIRWHMIGHLQSNKAKTLVPHLWALHSLDSLKLAKTLHHAVTAPPLRVFIQVNIDDESTKGGVSPSDVDQLAKEIGPLHALRLAGLMCIPKPLSAPIAAPFERVASVGRALLGNSCQLSMGMSSDFEIAIAAGADHVRIGTAIFGERKR